MTKNKNDSKEELVLGAIVLAGIGFVAMKLLPNFNPTRPVSSVGSNLGKFVNGAIGGLSQVADGVDLAGTIEDGWNFVTPDVRKIDDRWASAWNQYTPDLNFSNNWGSDVSAGFLGGSLSTVEQTWNNTTPNLNFSSNWGSWGGSGSWGSNLSGNSFFGDSLSTVESTWNNYTPDWKWTGW